MAGSLCPFVQPYAEALAERMQPFSPEVLLAMSDEENDEEDEEDDDYRGKCIKALPSPEPLRRVINLSCDGGDVVGTIVSGDEIFRIKILTMEHAVLQMEVANALGVDPSTLSFRQGESEITQDEVIIDIGALVVVQSIDLDPFPVFVCKRGNPSNRLSLGEARVQFDLSHLSDYQTLQGIVETRQFVTGSRDVCWLIYTKEQVLMTRVGWEELVIPVGFFPPPPAWPLPPSARQWGGPNCDVWSARVELPSIRAILDGHAARTNDRPIPRYQMVVDPNQFVHRGRDWPVWVPCEFDVQVDGSVRLCGGERSHASPELAELVATPVLTAALPLLARLRRPRLLLDQRRLQVVFKAQRIIVPPKVIEGSDSDYVGLWHVDGLIEHVVAVVLYYYNVDPSLEGGNMEFCGREPMDVLGFGDCSNNVYQFNAGTLRSALRSESAVQNCCVPVGEGTLLVFSNYQMVHRVLRMANSSCEADASRDFVALFIIDPAVKPLVPAKIHLAQSYLIRRTLRGKFDFSSTQLILEFAGELPSLAETRRIRNQMLRAQLQPQGKFAELGNVYSTGNGCFTMIGWLHHMLDESDGNFRKMFDGGFDRLEALNLPPEKLNRGMSEMLSLPSSELGRRLGGHSSERSR